MILDRIAARTFIPADQLPEYEDLQLVSRHTQTLRLETVRSRQSPLSSWSEAIELSGDMILRDNT